MCPISQNGIAKIVESHVPIDLFYGLNSLFFILCMKKNCQRICANFVEKQPSLFCTRPIWKFQYIVCTRHAKYCTTNFGCPIPVKTQERPGALIKAWFPPGIWNSPLILRSSKISCTVVCNSVSTQLRICSSVVFESPVTGLEKDCNWTRLDWKKDWTTVLVFGI